MTEAHRPLRLKLDGGALVHNWRTLAKAGGGAATGAAVKADGYGLGARDVVSRLAKAGCRDFFVANWAEALAIADLVPPGQIAVLNGVQDDDLPTAVSRGIVPVLNSPSQIARWKSANGGRCHVMLDSGMNRLGIGLEQLSPVLFDGLNIDIAMSHLASADEDVPQNAEQRARYVEMLAAVSCQRRSLANSAAIQLGPDYHFDLTRPGISLYGGIVRPELEKELLQVARIEAQLLQVRKLRAGDAVGYNATYICPHDMTVATLGIGYADGYLRGFSDRGSCFAGAIAMPVIGRVSMDLLAIDVTNVPDISEGDWVEVNYRLAEAATQSGLSQYELLTGLSDRFDRSWV